MGSSTRRESLLRLIGMIAVLLLGPIAARSPADEPDRPIDYSRDVRPILARHCFACHGPDEGQRQKGLRLDRRESATAPLADGTSAIVPGDPESSELVFRITEEDETVRMPPKKAGNRLTAAEVATLTRWVAQGATFAEHWAFQKPVDRPPPRVKDQGWPRNGIDYWVLDRLEKEGLAPASEADRFQLLRRASLDLRGLPPTPVEVEAFARDRAPEAFERAVDRFLDDPAFGERWARVWLDLARYADSAGYGSDPLRPNIWRYRDWVIDAFNRNLPFDRFTVAQLAGDLLPDATIEDRMATAFHRNTMTNTEGGTDDEEFRVAAVKDRVDTTLQVWMGLTAGCAKCHSHKFDPISQSEYYALFAIFNQTADNDQPDERPLIEVPTSEYQDQARKFEARIAALKAELDVETLEQQLAIARPDRTSTPGLEPLREAIASLEKSRPKPPTLPVMVELPPEKRRETHLLNKGNFLDPGSKVGPSVLSAFQPLPRGASNDRLGLARWLIDPENPLTGRVAVNRFWGRIFGIGLVETEEDFGTQGDLPSHPELLDWLAREYLRTGWDTKALLRLIVTSATYRQSSKVDPEKLARDPRNRLLARSPRLRLEAEMVRDQALALSGLLSRKLGGPSVFPYQPDGLWQAAFNGERTWTTSAGGDRHRRALYTFWRRTVPYPSMAAFDAPSREICTVRRPRTNTPLQAFVTLNDPVYVEAAQALARRIVREGGTTVEDRVAYALRLCLARPPSPSQVETLVGLFRAERDRYARDPEAARALATDPLGPLPEGWEPADLAAWTTLGNVLLNLDAVLTKG